MTKDAKGRIVDLEALDKRLNGGGGSIIGEKLLMKGLSTLSRQQSAASSSPGSINRDPREPEEGTRAAPIQKDPTSEGSTPTASDEGAADEAANIPIKKNSGWV